ncbi:discoidin domain-containing protein [Pectobacterium carotovorum]|uniref:discoidin domain-containing protein n=1 Tax=Pectobacterium carotovorum TaxID=554 RepID=UPI001CC1DF17|nr:discoidin domain-containing protein [Pectobacterium carotovorum]UCZ78470.1 discoidin domain-containing protein [Pectobacterium carotovorum]
MKNFNIEINVCDSTGKSTCTVHPPINVDHHTCCNTNSQCEENPNISGVSSVFGRTGVVTAQAGDYTADQITETATRKFVTPDEKSVWNAKQSALISGTNIRTLFGQSLLGSGDFSPTPAQMGAAAATHTHTTSDITDYTQKTKQLIADSLEAGNGVTLSHNASNGKTVISATVSSGSGNGGYTVVNKAGAAAGENHLFNISSQTSYAYDAYALKEEKGASNQTYLVDDFDSASKLNYNSTSAVNFNGSVTPFTGDTYELQQDGGFHSAEIKADGEFLSIVPETSTSIIPVMTSDTAPTGYVASASNFAISTAAFHPYVAFDGKDNIGEWPDCWSTDNQWLPSVANPHWLRIDLPEGKSVLSYQMVNRSRNELGNPKSWKFQGSNDNGGTWDTLHEVTDSADNNPGSKRSYKLGTTVTYKSYRLLITAKNGNQPFTTLAELNLFSPIGRFVIHSNSKYYGVANGVLSEITGELTKEKIDQFGVFSLDKLPTSGKELSAPVKIVSNEKLKVKTTYIPFPQIVLPKELMHANAWEKINSATLTAVQTNAGKVRVAVSRDLNDWFTWDGTAWLSIGALSADTTGATALIQSGMTPAALNAVTAAQWGQLFVATNNAPDRIAFAFGLDVTDPAIDVSSIDKLALNVDNASSWKLQTPAEVEIRWNSNSITFRTVAAGNYKLAYQHP